jgi:hypothetical protein
MNTKVDPKVVGKIAKKLLVDGKIAKKLLMEGMRISSVALFGPVWGTVVSRLIGAVASSSTTREPEPSQVAEQELPECADESETMLS